jgi:hypothetical protein
MTREDLRAMEVKYALLDGDAPENQKLLPTHEEREKFFEFAGEVFSIWIELPQAEALLSARTWERIERQKEFQKIQRVWIPSSPH